MSEIDFYAIRSQKYKYVSGKLHFIFSNPSLDNFLDFRPKFTQHKKRSTSSSFTKLIIGLFIEELKLEFNLCMFQDGIHDSEMCRQDAGGAEDVEMGKCMNNLGVLAGDSRWCLCCY